MIDYEKLADGVQLPPSMKVKDLEPIVLPDMEAIEEVPASPNVTSILRPDREYLPVTHEKYQGIATAKGYALREDRIKKTNYSHEAMIDVIISEPTLSQKQLAERFGRTQGWISMIVGSDAFQAALSKRRDDILDPSLVATIEERLRGLATQSLEIITEKLETSRSLDTAVKSLEIATKALGFGARAAGGNTVQNNFVVQLPPKMENSADWSKQHSGGRVIES